MPAGVLIAISILEALAPLFKQIPGIVDFLRNTADDIEAMGENDPSPEQWAALDAKVSGHVAGLKAAVDAQKAAE